MTTLVLEKIWKEYGDQIVLENIDITIESGSFVALVGPSGCGKTTLLKMLLGEERPTSGRILLDGVPLKPEPDWDRGVVFQRYSVFPHLTVLGNVLVGREFEKSRLLGPPVRHQTRSRHRRRAHAPQIRRPLRSRKQISGRTVWRHAAASRPRAGPHAQTQSPAPR